MQRRESMSTNVNLGSGRNEVSIMELTRMKISTESLIGEIKTRTANVTAQARSVANSASAEYGVLVSSQTNAVVNQCNTLATASSDAIRELEALVKGLDQVIDGYLSLEHTLATACSTEYHQNLWGAAMYPKA